MKLSDKRLHIIFYCCLKLSNKQNEIIKAEMDDKQEQEL